MPTDLAKMTAFISLAMNSEVTDQQIQLLINLSQLEEVEGYPWARLQTDFTFNSFQQYTAGTVVTTQGSSIVTGTGTNWTPSMEGMYMAVGQTTTPSTQFVPIPIDAVQSATQLTLRTQFPLGGGSPIGYQIFPLFYSISGMQRVISVKQQIPLGRRTHQWINLRDPYRQQRSSPAVNWAPFGQDDDGNAKIELWPIETNQNPYGVYGLKSHTDMVNPTDIPLLPAGLLIAKTMGKCAEVRFSQTGDPRWAAQRDYYYSRYDIEREKAIESDREEFGVSTAVQDSSGDPDSGQYVPGLDAIFNKDVFGQ